MLSTHVTMESKGDAAAAAAAAAGVCCPDSYITVNVSAGLDQRPDGSPDPGNPGQDQLEVRHRDHGVTGVYGLG